VVKTRVKEKRVGTIYDTKKRVLPILTIWT